MYFWYLNNDIDQRQRTSCAILIWSYGENDATMGKYHRRGADIDASSQYYMSQYKKEMAIPNNVESKSHWSSTATQSNTKLFRILRILLRKLVFLEHLWWQKSILCLTMAQHCLPVEVNNVQREANNGQLSHKEREKERKEAWWEQSCGRPRAKPSSTKL